MFHLFQNGKVFFTVYFSDSDLASYILSAKDDALEEEMCHCCVVYGPWFNQVLF